MVRAGKFLIRSLMRYAQPQWPRANLLIFPRHMNRFPFWVVPEMVEKMAPLGRRSDSSTFPYPHHTRQAFLHSLSQPPPPLLTPHPLLPVWPAITALVERDKGSFRQSDQSPEIQACLGAAIQRANWNLVLINGFPDPQTKTRWLADALKAELKIRRETSMMIAAIDD